VATGKTAVRSEWTADELVLAIEASQRIARGATRGKVTHELAAELLREPDAVDATVRAVGNAAQAQPLLKALSAHLLADARATAQAAAAVRALWLAQRAAPGAA
jgi:hypothetical protein